MNTSQIFTIQNEKDFEIAALKVFLYQAQHNTVYKQYIHLLGVKPNSVKCVADMPFLPIEFFKSKSVYGSAKQPDIVFSSSGTTGMQTSLHKVADVKLYEESFTKGFELFYGQPSQFAVLALLPAYLERTGSSLIYMVESLISQSKQAESGFFLHNHAELYKILQQLKENGKPTLLIGVSFALLDFIEQYTLNFPELIIMETGGMKGRRAEMPRHELHAELCQGFGVSEIHSEYGMTELLSQAYSKGRGIFFTPPWMKILIRDTQNPLTYVHQGNTGGINVIDLANLYSCAFIETQDLGRVCADGGFEIQGRFDESDIRGCNLLVAN